MLNVTFTKYISIWTYEDNTAKPSKAEPALTTQPTMNIFSGDS